MFEELLTLSSSSEEEDEDHIEIVDERKRGQPL